jgi:hypothetical protein
MSMWVELYWLKTRNNGGLYEQTDVPVDKQVGNFLTS